MAAPKNPNFSNQYDAIQNTCYSISMEDVVAAPMVDHESDQAPEIASPGSGKIAMTSLQIPCLPSEGETSHETEFDGACDAITEAEVISMSQAEWGKDRQPGSTSREAQWTHTPFSWGHTFGLENPLVTLDPAFEEWPRDDGRIPTSLRDPEVTEQANAGECLWDGDLVHTAENPSLIPFAERNSCYQKPPDRRPQCEEDYYDDDGFLATATGQSEPSGIEQFSGDPPSDTETSPALTKPRHPGRALREDPFSIVRYLRPGTLGLGQLVPLVERTWPFSPFGQNLAHIPVYGSSLRTSLTYVGQERDED